MLAGSVCQSRLSVLIVVASSIVLVAFVFTFPESLSKATGAYAHRAQSYLSATRQHPSKSEIYNCDDPYRRPGYLYVDEKDYKNTRWIPYTREFLEAPEPEYAQYPRVHDWDLYFNHTKVDEEFVTPRTTPQQWMRRVQEEHRRRREGVDPNDWSLATYQPRKDGGGLGWLWGRRLLLVGDSVDRYQLQFFCEEFDRQMVKSAKGVHTTTTCSVPTFNFTIIHWHFSGSWTFRPDWWWIDEMEQVAFEERWEELFAPTLNTFVHGLNGRPDLLLWQGGLWDQRALWQAGEAHYTTEQTMGRRDRHLAWQEVRFVAARLKKFVGALHAEFGADVPAMFRAITAHQTANASDANLFELDRISRSIAEKYGHEVFEWGRILTAFSMFYMDRTHTDKGPASWLWSDMMLEYMARSVGVKDATRAPYFDNWEACHPYLVKWGGR